MTMTEIIYNLVSGLSIPEINAGVGTGNIKAKDGLLTFFSLPSPPADFATNRSATQYQFDIWHADIYQAEQYKEDVINLLSGTAGKQNGIDLIISMDSDLGGVEEDDGNIWHYIVIMNVQYTRRVY